MQWLLPFLSLSSRSFFDILLFFSSARKSVILKDFLVHTQEVHTSEFQSLDKSHKIWNSFLLNFIPNFSSSIHSFPSLLNGNFFFFLHVTSKGTFFVSFVWWKLKEDFAAALFERKVLIEFDCNESVSEKDFKNNFFLVNNVSSWT